MCVYISSHVIDPYDDILMQVMAAGGLNGQRVASHVVMNGVKNTDQKSASSQRKRETMRCARTFCSSRWNLNGVLLRGSVQVRMVKSFFLVNTLRYDIRWLLSINMYI